jgi:hypothetical protein
MEIEMSVGLEEFSSDPRSYAFELISSGVCTAETLAIACLAYMSHDEIRDVLDLNELSPRLLEVN